MEPTRVRLSDALRTALAGARRALAERVMMDGFDRGTTDAGSTVEQ